MAGLPAEERIILEVDTPREDEAERIARIAEQVGARFIKLGLELSDTTSWEHCSELAYCYGLDWVADAKLHDRPNTIVGAVEAIASLEHRPFGITMHTTVALNTMHVAQETAGDIKILGITVSPSITEREARILYKVPLAQKVMELAIDAAYVGIAGLVVAPKDLDMIKNDPTTKGLFTMVPGTRSVTTSIEDQARFGTPAAAVRSGADLLVIGRQITQADDPAEAYEDLVAEIMDVTE